MLAASCLFSSEDDDKVAKTPHGFNSYKRFTKDSKVYLKSSDTSNVTAKKDKEKDRTDAFICYIASFNILKYWVFITWKM